MKEPQTHLDINLVKINRMGKTAVKAHRKHFRANVRKPKRPDGSEAFPWMSNCDRVFKSSGFHMTPAFTLPFSSGAGQAFTSPTTCFHSPCSWLYDWTSSGFKDSKCLQVRGSFPTAPGRWRSLWKPENWALAVFHRSADLHVGKGRGQHVSKILHTLVWAWLSMSSTVEECWLQTFMLVCSCMFFSYSRTSSIVISERRSRRWQLPLLNANFQWGHFRERW